MSNRDDQFVGWAKVVYEKLARNVLLSDKGMDIEAFKREQEAILARAGYDLVQHALYCDGLAPSAWGHASALYEREITTHANAIPDLSTLPEETANDA